MQEKTEDEGVGGLLLQQAYRGARRRAGRRRSTEGTTTQTTEQPTSTTEQPTTTQTTEQPTSTTEQPTTPGPEQPTSTTEQPISLDFGGWTHKLDKDGDRMRPELVKMLVCDDDAKCSECTEQSACWSGNTMGSLRLDVPASSPHNRFEAEVWASCAGGTGNWSVHVPQNGVQNGLLNVYVDGALFKTVTEIMSSGSDTNLDLPIVQSSRVRAEFVRTGTTTTARGQIYIFAKNVDVYVDDCMGVKNCLAALIDGTDSAFRFRNSNAEQLQCLYATTTAEQEQVSNECPPWVSCLDQETGRKEKLKILLKAGLGNTSDQGSLIVRSGQHRNDDPDCLDPSVEDVESWDCECMTEMEESCGGVDEACFRAIICGQDKVCSSWKEANCGSSLSSIAQRNSSLKGNILVMRREVNTDIDARATKAVASDTLGQEKQVLATRSAGAMMSRRAQQTSTEGGTVDDVVAGKCTTETRL